MASIRFDKVSKRYADGTVAVRELCLDVPDGEFMILVGPSGCGKTTALRMVAGLEDISEGQVQLGERVVNKVDPGHRDVAMVFQNYALFPHMSVFDNMAFPLRMRGVAKRETTGNVTEAARMLDLTELLSRKPSQLSGGQRQRVAMGRAIVRHPEAFLMDEPLSNLDAKLRTQMRGELARLHHRLGVTTLYVTHDQTEAMTLGSRVAVMHDGLVQQVGTPQELYRTPRNAFVARFIGSPSMNLLRGTLREGRLWLEGESDALDVSSRWAAPDGKVLVGIRPESCEVNGSSAAAEDALTVTGDVDVVEDLGAEMIVYSRQPGRVAGTAADEDDGVAPAFAARLSGGHTIAPGDAVRFRVARAALHLFDADSGDALPARDGGPAAPRR
jgi:multiple sugar transport system ATP-binding protein